MTQEIGFEMAASNIRFGRGVTTEIGMDLKDLGVEKVMVLTDANIAKLPMTQTVIKSLEDEGVNYVLYQDVRVEPTDGSLKDVGFSEADIPKLVEGTLPQHRVTKLSPRPAGAKELADLFKGAMQYW